MIRLILLLFIFAQNSSSSVLFVGDSITAYAGGWQDMYCKEKKVNKTNLSIGGKRTDYMLYALKKQKISSYEKVFIYGGINDIFSQVNVDTVVSNVQKMVNIINSKGSTAVVVLGYNANIISQDWIKDKVLEKSCKDKYTEYQNKLKKIKNATIIPIIKLEPSDLHDGIHPNQSGFVKLFKAIKNY